MILKPVYLLPIAYLLGSIPFGVLFTRLFAKIDIQDAGSGNIGAHNVYRLTGAKLALATLLGDILKGVIPMYIALCWMDKLEPAWLVDLWLCLVALSAFFGHLYSVFLKFNGGKGVATAAGCFLVIAPMVFFVCLLFYILVLCVTGYSSAGSLSAAFFLPLVTWPATHSFPITACALVMATMIFARHRDNIARLIGGTEHRSFRQ